MKLKKTVKPRNLNVDITDAIHKRVSIIINANKISMAINSFETDESESRFDSETMDFNNADLEPATINAINNLEKQLWKEAQKTDKYTGSIEIEEVKIKK